MLKRYDIKETPTGCWCNWRDVKKLVEERDEVINSLAELIEIYEDESPDVSQKMDIAFQHAMIVITGKLTSKIQKLRGGLD